MPELTIRNIPTSVYERLSVAAEEHGQSMDQHALHLIESALGAGPVDVEAILSRVRAMRRRAVVPAVMEERLRKDREAGRA